MLNKPHVHAEVIKAWADGATIQFKDSKGQWHDVAPYWETGVEYRVKPQKNKCWVLLMNINGVFMTTTADSEGGLTNFKELPTFVRVLQEIEYEV